jgi:hypothetical protein
MIMAVMASSSYQLLALGFAASFKTGKARQGEAVHMMQLS